MTDRITPIASSAATAQVARWLDDAPRTTIRDIAGATNKKTDAMRMFLKLETGTVVALDAKQIDWLESNIHKTRAAHEKLTGKKGL